MKYDKNFLVIDANPRQTVVRCNVCEESIALPEDVRVDTITALLDAIDQVHKERGCTQEKWEEKRKRLKREDEERKVMRDL